MYWILLSIGAINSFIPIAIIIVFIAAAAGATRGYSLLSLFGISTLIGAGSGGKKGSMAGKTGYSSFMRSGSRYPSGFGVSLNKKDVKTGKRIGGLVHYISNVKAAKSKPQTYNMWTAPPAAAATTVPKTAQAAAALGGMKLATMAVQKQQPRVPPTSVPPTVTSKLTPEEEGARLRRRINASGANRAGLLGFVTAVAFTGYAFKEFFRAVPMAIPVKTKGGKHALKVTPQNYGELVKKQSPRMGYYLNALVKDEGPPGRVYGMAEMGMFAHPNAKLRGRERRTGGRTKNVIPLGFRNTFTDIGKTWGKTAALIPLGLALSMVTMLELPVRPFVSEKTFESISLSKRVSKAPILRDVTGNVRSPLMERSVDYEEERLKRQRARLEALEKANLDKATNSAGKAQAAATVALLTTRTKLGQVRQDLSQIEIFKDNLAKGVTAPLAGVSSSTSARVMEAMKSDMQPKPSPSPLSYDEREHLAPTTKRELTPYEKELLSKDPDPYIRYLFAGNTAAIKGNVELQSRLSQDPDVHVQWRIARTADSEEVQKAIAQRGDKHSLWSLSQNEDALSHSSIQETLASKGDIYVLTNLAGSNVSQTTQDTLIERSRKLETAAGNNTEEASRAVSIRRELARSENISSNTQDALALDPDQNVRVALAGNAWATNNVMNTLTAQSQPEEVRNAAAKNTNLQVHMDAMLNLAKDTSVKIRQTIASIEAPRVTKQHPSLTPGEEAARKAVEETLVYMAKNETDKSVLNILLKNKSRNDRTDAALLSRDIIKKS